MIDEILKYTPLLGRHVRIERPCTDAEKAVYGSETYGGEGMVAKIEPAEDRAGVAVIFDYGMGVVLNGEENWKITIYADDETAATFRAAPEEAEVQALLVELNRRSRYGARFSRVGRTITLSPTDARSLLAWMNTAQRGSAAVTGG